MIQIYFKLIELVGANFHLPWARIQESEIPTFNPENNGWFSLALSE